MYPIKRRVQWTKPKLNIRIEDADTHEEIATVSMHRVDVLDFISKNEEMLTEEQRQKIHAYFMKLLNS